MNEKMILSKKDNFNLVFTHNVLIGARNQSKLIIYLDTIKLVEYENDENSFMIKILTNDIMLSNNIISEIYNFLIKLNIIFDIDDEIKSSISDVLITKSEKKSANSKILNLKEKDCFVNDLEFIDYCKRIDNLLDIKLRDYQYKASYLLSLGAGGFDFSVPGAGKTIISYSVFAELKSCNTVSNIFIIGPLNSYNAWYEEYITCFGKEPSFENLANSSTDYCRAYLQSSINLRKEVTFINFDKIRYLTNEISKFLNNSNTLLVIDEAHKVKNPEASVTKSAMEIAKFSDSKILLTGTPIPNGYEDLYSLTKILSPYTEILPYKHARLKKLTQTEVNGDEFDKIKNSIKPYYSRISKKYLIEKGELNPFVENIKYSVMDSEQRALYDRLDNFFRKQSLDCDEFFLSHLKKAALIRKMQISANPALLKKSISDALDQFRDEQLDVSEKNDIENLEEADKILMNDFFSSAIVKTINSYASGKLVTQKNIQVINLALELISKNKKVLIWDVFVDNIKALSDYFENSNEYKAEVIFGGVSSDERQRIIKSFRTGDTDILIANPATLAESISLHRHCQNAIYVNRNFNAAQFIQSKDRIHRINMPEGTTASYYYVFNEESIDTKVDERLRKKEDRMLSILDSDEISISVKEFGETTPMNSEDIDFCFD